MKTRVETKISPGGTDLDKEGKEPILFSISEQEIQGTELTCDELAQNSELSGVFCKGVQYYDFSHIRFINNNGIANLISLLKASLKQGVQIHLVNVRQKIKDKIKAIGLDNVIKCS